MNKFLAYRKIPNELYRKDATEILRFTKEELGLDPNEVDFIFVPQNDIHVLAGYLFPVALPHWSRGRDIILTKRDTRTTIYEIVFNTDPAMAFVAETAKPGEVQLIFAHVYGHSHIFKNNIYESKDTDLLGKVRYAMERYHAYEAEYGPDRLDALIDFVHALRFTFSSQELSGEIGQREESQPPILLNKNLLRFVAPKQGASEPNHQPKQDNIIQYILDKSQLLEDWERDIIRIELDFVRHLYRKAKLRYVHEGFATWTHRKAYMKLLNSEEFFGATMLDIGIYPSLANPYWFGSVILEALELDGVNIPELVKQISDEELFYSYFTEDVWQRILRNPGLAMNSDERLASMDKYAEVRGKLMESIFTPKPQIYVDSYADYVPSDGAKGIQIIKASPERYSGPKMYPLKLTSDITLDETYARATIRVIAEVWRGDVYIRYPI